MKDACDSCGYDPSGVRASLRLDWAVCEECGRALCEQCLKKGAVEAGLLTEAEADDILANACAQGLLARCDESGMWLCAECFEDETPKG